MNAVLKDRDDSPRDEIVAIVRSVNFDYDAATDKIVAAMARDAQLRNYVQREGARYLARNVTGNIREACVRDMDAPIAGEPNAKHVAYIRSFLEDFTLPGGTPIGEARRADLKAAIEYYGEQEIGMRKARRFLEAVGKKLPEGKRVREVFTDAQLKRMQRDAR
jgi:hypothetical protein